VVELFEVKIRNYQIFSSLRGNEQLKIRLKTSAGVVQRKPIKDSKKKKWQHVISIGTTQKISSGENLSTLCPVPSCHGKKEVAPALQLSNIFLYEYDILPFLIRFFNFFLRGHPMHHGMET
jgi:hypothetical protein